MVRLTQSPVFRTAVCGLVLAAVGTTILYFVSVTTDHGNASKNWPTVKAEITESHLSTARFKKRKSRAKITYTYRVGNQDFIGKRIQFGEMSTSQSKAQAIVNTFPVGKIVDVYYNPEDPEMAVLETGVGKGLIIVKIVCWIVLVTGVLMIAAIPYDMMQRRPRGI